MRATGSDLGTASLQLVICLLPMISRLHRSTPARQYVITSRLFAILARCCRQQAKVASVQICEGTTSHTALQTFERAHLQCRLLHQRVVSLKHFSPKKSGFSGPGFSWVLAPVSFKGFRGVSENGILLSLPFTEGECQISLTASIYLTSDAPSLTLIYLAGTVMLLWRTTTPTNASPPGLASHQHGLLVHQAVAMVSTCTSLSEYGLTRSCSLLISESKASHRLLVKYSCYLQETAGMTALLAC